MESKAYKLEVKALNTRYHNSDNSVNVVAISTYNASSDTLQAQAFNVYFD